MFTSCYHIDKRTPMNSGLEPGPSGEYQLNDDPGTWYYKRYNENCTYPMGTDPIWGISSNKLTYINGIKMKLSVIFGVLHMTMGIIHKGTNTVYFKDWPSFFTEVVAGTIILLGLFGWMDLLIIAKWLKPLNIEDATPTNKCDPTQLDLETNVPEENLVAVKTGDCDNQKTPSVINIMIDTVFNFGTSKTPDYRAFIGPDVPT